MDPTHQNVGTIGKASDVLEIGLQIIGRTEQISLTADDKDADRQYGESSNNESTEARSS
jgi:hypothetical protein